jgi:hypothetical protein
MAHNIDLFINKISCNFSCGLLSYFGGEMKEKEDEDASGGNNNVIMCEWAF